VTDHTLRTREDATELVATCACGLELLRIQWTGAGRDDLLARFRRGAAQAHRGHLRYDVPYQPPTAL
jgi:hypothetical protein